jgi:hypothetical protein
MIIAPCLADAAASKLRATANVPYPHIGTRNEKRYDIATIYSREERSPVKARAVALGPRDAIRRRGRKITKRYS